MFDVESVFINQLSLNRGTRHVRLISHRSTVENAAAALAEKLGAAPELAVIAGSGLGAFVDALEAEASCGYDEIPGLPEPSVAGHAGRAVVGKSDGKRVLILGGRSHLYEGCPPEQAVAAVRAAGLWGCKILLVTNAAGGVNPQYRPGDLMLIADHINLSFRSATRGANGNIFGPRFTDLCNAYDPQLRAAMREAASAESIALREGVYCSNLGPTFETPAEGRMLRGMGVDAVGMSTVPEVIAARQMGLRVAGLSYISNSLVHKPEGKTTHDEVLDNSRLVRDSVKRLLKRFVRDCVM
jgi:purine-nucleoside phosphorylase